MLTSPSPGRAGGAEAGAGRGQGGTGSSSATNAKFCGIRAARRRASLGSQSSSPRIIDTHHHIYPPKYVEPNLDRLLRDTTTLPVAAYTSWTPQFALDQMEKAGIATALVSMTSPGIWFDDGADPLAPAHEFAIRSPRRPAREPTLIASLCKRAPRVRPSHPSSCFWLTRPRRDRTPLGPLLFLRPIRQPALLA
jgi:hypothetical protein